MNSSKSNRSPQEIIEKCTTRWGDYEGLEETTLIRLAILRDVIRQLHADKSYCLATGMKSDAANFKAIETQIETLRTLGPLEGPLQDILLGTRKLKKRTRTLPEALYSWIPKEKFDRYDRAWETEIAAEASALGWRFWELGAWVKIHDAEKFHHGLNDRLLPNGVLLFAESAFVNPAEEMKGDSWHGRWLVVLKPRFRTPDFRVLELPGVVLEPSPPVWKPLYSPKAR